ncbi:MAG: hypothetical protein IKH57_21325 [Clostridia bacterium]|nr:hypothetical protein [Clostridia bacterium]
MIHKKTELELARENLESAKTDLYAYRKFEGQSPVIDANIRHKEAQVRQMDARVRELEAEELYREGQQLDMFEE